MHFDGRPALLAAHDEWHRKCGGSCCRLWRPSPACVSTGSRSRSSLRVQGILSVRGGRRRHAPRRRCAPCSGAWTTSARHTEWCRRHLLQSGSAWRRTRAAVVRTEKDRERLYQATSSCMTYGKRYSWTWLGRICSGDASTGTTSARTLRIHPKGTGAGPLFFLPERRYCRSVRGSGNSVRLK
jgi:hypothetical protein